MGSKKKKRSPPLKPFLFYCSKTVNLFGEAFYWMFLSNLVYKRARKKKMERDFFFFLDAQQVTQEKKKEL